jgi:hypothetical protein
VIAFMFENTPINRETDRKKPVKFKTKWIFHH